MLRLDLILSSRPVWVAIVAAIVASGCGGAATTDNSQQAINLVGVWTLRSVAGTPLPYDIPRTAGRSPGDTYQVYGGSLEITSNTAFYAFRDSTRYTLNGTASGNVIGDDGFVTQNGATLTLRSTRTAPVVTATLVGTSLHAIRDSLDYVYTR